MATTNLPNMTPGLPPHTAALFDALTSARPDDCTISLDQLNAYVEAQLAGATSATWFTALSRHLPLCPTCVSSYARLYRALLAEKEGRLGYAAPPRPFDLSFLTPATAPLFEEVRAALRQLGNVISLQLSTTLLQSLTPTPALALRGQSDEPFFTLEPDEALRAQWPATVTAYRDANQPDLCTVKVQVKPIDRPFPHRKGIQVTVAGAANRWQVSTDAYGNALFTGIPVAQLPTIKIDLLL